MPSEPADRVALLEAIAQSWNEADINYAVAHGLEGYPERSGRDLDVLVQRDQIELALKLAEAVFRKHAWRIAYPSAIWGRRLVAISGDRNMSMLEVHTLSEMTWRNTVFADYPAPRSWIGPFKIDPWLSFAKRIVGPLLGDGQRFTAKPEEFAATEEELQIAERRLPEIFGTKLAHELIARVRSADVLGTVRLTPGLRRAAMLRNGALRPFQSLKLLSKSVRRKLLQPFSPCAPIIAIVGPDGVGKSTTLRALRQSTEHVFVDVVIRHWRPGVLPRLAQLAGRQTAQPGRDGLLPPRRNPGRFHTARLLYYYMDFLIGGLIKDRLAASRQRLVLYDRCFLDMAVDPVRFGLASARGTDLCWRWLPKPDRIILLDDDASRIHARKAELPAHEIQKHLDEWHRQAALGRIDTVIATEAAPEHIAERIWGVISEAFLEINGWHPRDQQARTRD